MQPEAELVRFLQRRFPARGRVRVGVGDDAAVLASPPGCRTDWVVTTDLLVEDVHFLRAAQSPRAVGWKALARSLSDLAAMAATPRIALVALAVPRTLPRGWVEEFFSGLAALARRAQVEIAGGDLSSAAQIVADVQVIGEVKKGKALLRSGARPGQSIFVSGRLGLAGLGLLCLRARLASVRPLLKRALRAQLFPQPRLGLAQKLAHRGATAMIDLSDGLSTDLNHLCEASCVGAQIYLDRLPAVQLTETLAHRFRTTGLELALHGGEDYELLFSLPPREAARLPTRLTRIPLTWIGEITRGKGVVLVEEGRRGRERRVEPCGWDHFRPR